jgi:hypothetical protein
MSSRSRNDGLVGSARSESPSLTCIDNRNISNAYAATNVFGSWLYKITVSGGFCTNGSYVYSKWFNG